MRTVFYCICAYAVKSRFMRAQGESGYECVISEIAKGCKTKKVMLWQIAIPIIHTNLKNICCFVKDDNKYKKYTHLIRLFWHLKIKHFKTSRNDC